jgi:CheY-like chemotaxis protein/nitrogen-specific signal transduction histidine kinase
MSQVLIVDDEAGIRRLMRVILERAGYSVETAVDGQEGLRKFRQAPTDLVISDIIMPDMDGLEVLRTIKREKPAVDLIAISGGGRVDAGNYLDLATKLGARYAFKKPIDRHAFISAVDDILAAKGTSGDELTARSSAGEIAAQGATLSAESNLVQLVETLPHFFWILDCNRQVVLANSASLKALGLAQMEQLHGQRPGEVLGCQNAGLSAHGCGNAAACATCGALKAILSAQAGGAAVQECRLLPQTGGDALDLKVWTQPLALGDGSCIAFQVQDIAHEKRREALERTFFHDLLNIAGGLRNGLGMLDEMDPADRVELVPLLITASQGLIDEIEAQKDLLSIEEGTYATTLETFGARELLQLVHDCYRHHPVAVGRQLSVDGSSADIRLTSDRRLMTRVLGNMVKNALEACDEGDDVNMGCRVEEEGASDTVVFWVHNPQYMPKAVQLQIFQRSYSTKGRGRGLGTFGMRLLTERYLQGSVGFTSTAVSGTTFSARYPVTIDAIGV